MTLIRPIRLVPARPTADKLRRLMNEFGLSRKVVARLMRCSLQTVDAYLRPEGGAGAQPVPMARWELLRLKVAAIYTPDDPLDLTL